jgi:signal transduction histidine kinase
VQASPDGRGSDAVRVALDATMRRSLPLIFAGVGAFYLIVVLVTPFLSGGQPGPSRDLVARWIGTAAIGLLGGVLLRKYRPPVGWSNAFAGSLGILALVNSLYLIRAAGPAFQFALIVAVVAWALFLLSLRWVVAMCVLALAGWAALAADAGWGTEWAPRTFNLIAFCTVALVAQAMRLSLHRRLEVLKARDLERAQQEHELAREKALGEQRRRIVRLTAHELATPMTPVLLQADLLSRSQLTPEQRQNLDVLRRNLARLQETIKKVVAAAKADEEGKTVPELFGVGADGKPPERESFESP